MAAWYGYPGTVKVGVTRMVELLAAACRYRYGGTFPCSDFPSVIRGAIDIVSGGKFP
ncbi:hypothetical protein MJ570_00580 [Escherichia coli]|nr:hypothetical protein MJ570_00580 [Escherichia coli]